MVSKSLRPIPSILLSPSFASFISMNIKSFSDDRFSYNIFCKCNSVYTNKNIAIAYLTSDKKNMIVYNKPSSI